MAIYHLSGQIISRTSSSGNIRSAIACAAYRSGDKLFNERDNSMKNYKRNIPPTTKILAPKNAPNLVYNRERLWNEVEKVEKQYNAQLAREFNIALPVELNEEEQNKLAYDFCQKAFVDKGMVADISIHRDNKDNPHFHVMLTIRPFKENGEWAPKSKKEYILDENGEKIKLKSGNYKSKKIDTTDWNQKETMKIWRKQWEVMANKSLKDNGINARITCESNKSLGNEKVATIHEGYVARKMQDKGKESDRINQNKLIKEYNNTVINLNKFKEEKRDTENKKGISRYFSPSEKSILKNTANKLNMFINYENINERLKQLNRWERLLSFQDDSIEKTSKLNRIDNEEEILHTAKNVLKNEADRFIKNNYNYLDINELNIDEKIEIVNSTLDNKKILDNNQIKGVIDKVKEDQSQKIINDIFKNNIRFTISVRHDISHLENTFNALVQKYNIDFSNPESAKNVPENVINNMEKMINRKEELTQALNIFNKMYDNKLERMYPDWEGRLNLKIEEKEIFIVSEEYFGKTLMPDDFENIPYKYSTKQQEEILNLLDINNNEILKAKYPDFKFNEAFKNMFYMECCSNKDLKLDAKELVRDHFNKDNFMKNFKVFENVSTDDYKTSSFDANSLIFSMVNNLINEVDKRVQEDHFEKERLKKKV